MPGRVIRLGVTALRLLPLLLLYLAVCAIGQPGPEPVRDEAFLLSYVRDYVLTGAYIDPGAVADRRMFLWHGHGLPLVLAAPVALGLPLGALRFTGPLLLWGALLAFHALVDPRLGPRRALAATYALGLYAPFATVLMAVHKEPLAILAVVLALLGLARGLGEQGRWWHLAGAGGALGALTMVRLEYGWVLMALLGAALAWWALRRPAPVARRLAAVCALALVLCVPWLAHTHAITGRVAYWGTSAGLSLYWMSPTTPGATGTWHRPEAVAGETALRAHRPLFASLPADPVARDLALRRVAVANVRAHPLAYARNLGANASRLFFLWPMEPPRRAPVVASAVVFNGALALGVMWAGRRLWRRRRTLPPETLAFVLFAALGIGVHVPPSAQPRMLLPLVPVLAWLIALAAGATRPAPAARQGWTVSAPVGWWGGPSGPSSSAGARLPEPTTPRRASSERWRSTTRAH